MHVSALQELLFFRIIHNDLNSSKNMSDAPHSETAKRQNIPEKFAFVI